MNAAHRFALSLALLGGLAACASSPDSVRGTPAPQRSGVLANDDAYVARVERLASRRYMQVHWVNPPQRRVD